MIVVGLTGYARSGKDTVADRLVEEHDFEKVSFAKPLKDMLLKLNPQVGVRWTWRGPKPVYLDDVYVMYGTEEAVKASKYGEEIRGLWQRLGTDCVRKYDDLFWVRAAFQSLTDDNGRYVFTDVRFPNEAQSIQALQDTGVVPTASLWLVERPGVHPANDHESELHAGNMNEDYIIGNVSTIHDLNNSIDELVELVVG